MIFGFGWKNVNEELPGLGQWVLIANRDGNWTQAVLTLHSGHIDWMQNEPTIPAHDIFWWTHIPEPPQENRDAI